jgi:hypothetical protein
MLTESSWLTQLFLIQVAAISGYATVRNAAIAMKLNFHQAMKGIELYQKLRPEDSLWRLFITIMKEPLLPFSKEARRLPEYREMWRAYWKSFGYGLLSMVAAIIFLVSGLVLLSQLGCL